MGRQSVQQQGIGKSPRQSARARKKAAAGPVKVVYISNPMRVTTSAAKFRGIVQRLTGRDSNVAEMDCCAPGAGSVLLEDTEDDDSPGSPPPSAGSALRSLGGAAESGVDLYASTLSEMFDDAFAPQMLESSFPVMYEPQNRWIL